MPDTDQLFFETQRRVILFNSGTTMPDNSTLGYEGNPNFANTSTLGQALLYGAPRGTSYIELVNGNLWYKQKIPNTWINLTSGTSSGTATFSSQNNVVYTTGDQDISGVKNFSSRPTVNGSGVLLVGETGSVVLPNTLVYTTGDQDISGVKNFSSRPTVNGSGVLLVGETGSVVLPNTLVYTTGEQTIYGVKNFTSLKRTDINVSVIPTLKNIFDTNYPTTFWDYDTLQLPAERNIIYYTPTSWDAPKTRNIRLPKSGNLAGDSLVVNTTYMPPNSHINFYRYDPGPGWVLIDSWLNASFDALYRPFNLSMITYLDSNIYNTPWIKQANRWNVTPPASVNSAGTAGDLSFDGANIYVCVGQNNWRRLSASTWS